jgi:phospholipid/cholesterol/gamma-HCH transport system permease protein
MAFRATHQIILNFLHELGAMLIFLGEIIRTAFNYPSSRQQIFEQIWRVTIQSVSTTAMAGFFVGAIMTVQFAMQMNEFGALGYLGGLATSGTVREIGPLLIAFLLSGKIGAFTSAELGTMRVTEQIDAIRCLGANPIQEIIVPRFVAIVVASFFLLGAGLIMSIFGGALLGYFFAGVNYEQYIRHIPTIVTLPSIISGTFKSFIFALVLATICTYKGYTTTGGAKGVGRAVVQTAVMTMICIVVADWLTSMLSDFILRIAIETMGHGL